MDRPSRATPQNGPGSPSSGDDTTNKVTDEPSPKKSKRGVHKRVVSVPIGDVEGSKSKGDSFPPSDSWAWRKYGQKPIKGSPYPRGYYRCSSSKGCPARKQVERSRVDPTTLIITYACDHNHPIPSKSATSAPATSIEEPAAKSDDDEEEEEGEEAVAAFSGGEQGLGGIVGDGEGLLGGGFGIAGEWFGYVASTAVLESPIYGGADVDADVAFSAVSGEDESLFGDLGELPECAVVFRRRIQDRDCGSPLSQSLDSSTDRSINRDSVMRSLSLNRENEMSSFRIQRCNFD